MTRAMKHELVSKEIAIDNKSLLYRIKNPAKLYISELSKWEDEIWRYLQAVSPVRSVSDVLPGSNLRGHSRRFPHVIRR